jgi:hypothetical protein
MELHQIKKRLHIKGNNYQNQDKTHKMELVTQACKPSYLGGRDQEDVV